MLYTVLRIRYLEVFVQSGSTLKDVLNAHIRRFRIKAKLYGGILIDILGRDAVLFGQKSGKSVLVSEN